MLKRIHDSRIFFLLYIFKRMPLCLYHKIEYLLIFFIATIFVLCLPCFKNLSDFLIGIYNLNSNSPIICIYSVVNSSHICDFLVISSLHFQCIWEFWITDLSPQRVFCYSPPPFLPLLPLPFLFLLSSLLPSLFSTPPCQIFELASTQLLQN